MYISNEEILKLTLLFLRIGGILFFLPLFGDIPVPARFRMLCAFSLSIAFYQLVPIEWHHNLSYDSIGVLVLVAKELLVGSFIGFVAKIAFEGVVMAANLVGFQMGFGTANLLVPDSGEQMNAFAAIHRIVAISIFLSLNLHFIFFNGIAESLQVIPLGMMHFDTSIGEVFIRLSADLFAVALQLASPILVALLLTMAALGLAARAVPQLNVFVMSFPMSFFLGLLIYAASLPFFPEWIGWHFGEANEHIISILSKLKPNL